MTVFNSIPRTVCRMLSAVLLLSLALPLTAAEQSPHVQTEMLASRTGIVPGGSVDVAIRFQIDREWHIYWKNSGEGGDATTVRWKLPPGFTASEVRFPPPRRYVDRSGANTFILEGRPVLLATITAPESAKVGETARIVAEVSWLVCRHECILGEATLSVDLPIVGSEDESEPANERDFRRARSELPTPPGGKPKYLDSLSAVANVSAVAPGAQFLVAVTLDVQEGYHINSHRPLADHLVPTDLFHHRTDGLSFSRPIFPPGREETDERSNEKLSVYRDQTTIYLPAQADNVLEGDSLTVSGIVFYQACNDAAGQCFPPTAATWEVTLPVAQAGTTVTAAHPELFKDVPKPDAVDAGSRSPSQADSQSHAAAGPPDPRMPQMSQRSSITFVGRSQEWLAAQGIWGILLMAFIGGFVLNLMPCVLPVISIKVLSFVQQAGESRLRVFTLGMAFSAGILLSFAILGVLIVTAGYQWGGLFQSPHAVLAMCAIVTAFALSLFGVFTLQPPRLVTTLGSRVQQEGHLNAFGMGLLATALGTACTAPFLGFALALAVKHPPIVGLLIFLFAGIGMAAPYIALAAHPAWLRFLPRPGPWMKTFEHIMGFMLLGTVIWLLFSVNRQLGGTGLFLSLIFLLVVALASWLYGKAEFGISPVRRAFYYGAALLVIIVGWRTTFSGERSVDALLEKQRAEQRWLAERVDPTRLQWDGPFPWKPYLRERALNLVREGYTVFVDYTASWCANCITNERLVIDTPEVREVMERLAVLPLQADYSERDPEISEDLQKFNRAGVPMYLVYPAGRPDEPIVLDEILTKEALIAALEQAGPSRVGKMARSGNDGSLTRTD